MAYIPRPAEGDIVELILADHRVFEAMLRELRDEQSDRDDVRRQLSALLTAHGEAEEEHVYPSLRRKDAIDADEAEHGEEEHTEIYEALLPVLEASELYDDDFSNAIHELSETLSHHVDEEERDILNPARTEVGDADRARLGSTWAAARNRLLDEGCGDLSQIRQLARRD